MCLQNLQFFLAFFIFFCERDSSGTTVATRKRREGDGADSPTRAAKGSEAARPTNCAAHNLIKN
jgi:hypothetical protein